jgi:acetyl-CoA acyltransferase
MTSAVIVDAVRTPIGRAHPHRGWFRHARADDLAAGCIRALIQRTGIDPAEVEDVVFGCTQQTKEQGLNVARIASLVAGLPVTVAGTTINRLCGSSLQAINQAAHSIVAGAEDVQIVGGLEHMHHLPMDHALDVNPRLFTRTSPAALKMGLTAELLASRYGISRDQQDAFAFRSHQRASAAETAGAFDDEMLPTFGHDESANRILLHHDQCVRPDTSLSALGALKPAFIAGGTVTAGNSSPINDGAAALLMMSELKARDLALKPLVRIRSSAVIGVQPSEMGLGPVAATQKALRRAGLNLADIDLIELNEAFAVQTLACAQLLGIDDSRLNIRGGALAIGHPLGASGARIATTLTHTMAATGAKFGLATMCIGLGQGIATVFERVE